MEVRKIRNHTDLLKSDTASMEACLKTIKKKIRAMKTEVEQLNRMWEGDAKRAFYSAFQNDITDLDIICDGIQGIITYEKNAKKEYETCERKVEDLIDSIKI